MGLVVAIHAAVDLSPERIGFAPVEPVLDEGGSVLVAHGATEDKGQSYTNVKSGRRHRFRGGFLPINVKFIEGETHPGQLGIHLSFWTAIR